MFHVKHDPHVIKQAARRPREANDARMAGSSTVHAEVRGSAGQEASVAPSVHVDVSRETSTRPRVTATVTRAYTRATVTTRTAERPSGGNIRAATPAAPTKAMLNSTSYSEKIRPRNSSS